jgi:hypothetical protein
VGDDSITGGAGTDLVDYSQVNVSVTVDLGTGTATGDGTDKLTDIENATGGSGADQLTGSTGNNELTGGAGNDTLSGGLGNDVLYSGDGNDSVDAGEGNDLIIGGDGAGNDIYNGGAGVDTVKYTSAKAAIAVDLSAATNQAQSVGTGDLAGIGVDQLSNIENVIAGNFNDLLTGNSLNNQLQGGLGNDTLSGGAGNDILVGGAGSDVLTGGAGVDWFVLDSAFGVSNVDVFKDFTSGSDKMLLNQSVFSKFVGTAAGSAIKAGNLVVGASGATSAAVVAKETDDYLLYDTTTDKLYYDADGSGSGAAVWCATVELAGTKAPVYTDFLVVI